MLITALNSDLLISSQQFYGSPDPCWFPATAPWQSFKDIRKSTIPLSTYVERGRISGGEYQRRYRTSPPTTGINPCYAGHGIHFRRCKSVFPIISQHWGIFKWNLSQLKARTRLYCIVNTMAADGLATKELGYQQSWYCPGSSTTWVNDVDITHKTKDHNIVEPILMWAYFTNIASSVPCDFSYTRCSKQCLEAHGRFKKHSASIKLVLTAYIKCSSSCLRLLKLIYTLVTRNFKIIYMITIWLRHRWRQKRGTILIDKY